MIVRIVIAMVLAAGAAGCGDAAPTAPSSAASPRTELFTGTLTAGSSRFYSFTVGDPSYVTAMLASVNVNGPAVTTPLGLAFGTPAGTDCAMAEAIATASALTPQLSAYKASGVHCVRVYDIGTLTTAVGFSIRIVHF